MATMRWMEEAFCRMNWAVRWASEEAVGMARDPPG